jgi:poly(3-hydroxybutyrate) depolymerase
MRSSVTSNVVLVVLVGGIASVWGCTVADEGGGNGGSAGDIFGTAGMAGTTPVGTAGTPSTAGTPGMGGSVGAAGTPATGGVSTTAGAGGMSTAGTGGVGTAGAGGGSGGGSATGPITKVWKADGCGKAFGGQSGQKATIMTMGVKAPNCAAKLQDGTPRCGAWGADASTWLKTPLPRDYWVYLPANYDSTKAYPLLFEGPGCGGNGGGVYGMNAIKDQFIRIGISPPNPLIGHGTNPGQGCFDDKEGDDSVDWVFYENLYDKLNAELCFDRNRVFSNGDSSGSWFSNEVGCKYAGDATRPIRGVLPNTGGLPVEPQFEPTCTAAPMAGIWMHEVGDTENAFSGNKFAISRAMTVNKCTGSAGYDDAVAKGMVEDFQVAGLAAGTCKLIKGCPEIYPLVVCPLPGNVHQSHNTQVEAAFPTFLKLFSQGNFLTQ